MKPLSDICNWYMHACMHTYIHTYNHAYIHTCMHARIHAYIHTYTHTDIHILMFSDKTSEDHIDNIERATHFHCVASNVLASSGQTRSCSIDLFDTDTVDYCNVHNSLRPNSIDFYKYVSQIWAETTHFYRCTIRVHTVSYLP